VLAVPLLAVVVAMLVMPFLRFMTMLLRSPEGPIGVQKQEHPNQISFVECPRFMALRNGRRREGSVKAARSWARSSQRSGEP
jgi:hypothetical protein